MTDKSPEVLAEAHRKGVEWLDKEEAWCRPSGEPMAWVDDRKSVLWEGSGPWLVDTGDGLERRPNVLAALQALPPTPTPVSMGDPLASGVGLADDTRAALAAALAPLDVASWTLPQVAAEVVRRLGTAEAEVGNALRRLTTCAFCGNTVVEGLGGHTSACYERRLNVLRARVAELEARREPELTDLLREHAVPEPPALTAEAIALRCGLVKASPTAWSRPSSLTCAVWKAEIGWNWDAGDGLHGKEMSPEAALRAYAAARGVALGEASAEQPAPTTNTGDCARELLDVLDQYGLAAIRPALEARRALGVRRYGVPLGRGNGRDGARDLRDELLDGAIYGQAEHGQPRGPWWGSLELLRAAQDPQGWAAEVADLRMLRGSNETYQSVEAEEMRAEVARLRALVRSLLQSLTLSYPESP